MDELTRAMEAAGYRPGVDEIAVLAVQLGLWLRPMLGAEPELRGRVVIYDYTAHRMDVDRQIGRGIVEHISKGPLASDDVERAIDRLCGTALRRTGPLPARDEKSRSAS